MQFVVVAYDDVDDQALERRMEARPAHLEAAKANFDQGRWLYAVAILNDEGTMIGSMIVCDYPSRSDLDEQWLKNEPYVTGKVWKKIDVKRAQVPPHLQQ